MHLLLKKGNYNFDVGGAVQLPNWVGRGQLPSAPGLGQPSC